MRKFFESVALFTGAILYIGPILLVLYFIGNLFLKPNTTLNNFLSPFNTGDGLHPYDAADEDGRVRLWLGSKDVGMPLNIPVEYFHMKVSENPSIIHLNFNYETLGVGSRGNGSTSDISLILHSGMYRDGFGNGDFAELKERKLLIKESENIWRVDAPRTYPEKTNRKAEFEGLKRHYYPTNRKENGRYSMAGYYYIQLPKYPMLYARCAVLCSLQIPVNKHVRAQLSGFDPHEF
jgi:hypothetical protein